MRWKSWKNPKGQYHLLKTRGLPWHERKSRLLWILGKPLHVIFADFSPSTTFWQGRYVASCFFSVVWPPYCIVFCSVCPLTVNLLLQEPATVHRCVHVDRVLYLHAGQRVLLHSAHQRRVSVLLGSRCGKKLSTLGVVYKTKGCTIRKPQVVVKNKGLW